MTRTCLNWEVRKGMARFTGETFTIEHAGTTAPLEGLSGWHCGACEEMGFDAESARRYAVAAIINLFRLFARNLELLKELA